MVGIFLDAFVEFFNHIQERGIPCVVKNEDRIIYPYVLEFCIDTVAQAPIQGIVQFNGYFGCAWCQQKGLYYCGCVRYSIDQDTIPRDDEETADNIKILPEMSAEERKKLIEQT